MYKKWNNDVTGDPLSPAQDASGACALNIGANTGQAYGNGKVKWYFYADLSSYKKLVIFLEAGEFRLMYNRNMVDGNPGADGQGQITLSSTSGGVVSKDGKIVTIDIASIVSTAGYMHLNAIKDNWGGLTISKMYLVKDGPLSAGEEEFMEYVDDGIPSAPLTSFNYQKWDGAGADSNPIGAFGSNAAIWGVNSDLVFGRGNVDNNGYADLSSFARLEMVVSGAVPRLLFNRQMNGTGLIEIRDGVNTKYVKTYPADGGTLYVYNIAQFVADNGYCHLQAIKGSNYGWLTLKSAYVRGTAEATNAFKAQASANVEGSLAQNDNYPIIDTRNVAIASPINSNFAVKSGVILANAGQFDASVKNVCVNGTIAELSLTDGYPFVVPAGATATAATYSRTVSGTYGTICLPYAVASDANVQYYTLGANDGESLTIVEAANVAAGTPAIFKKLGANDITFTGAGALADAQDGSASTGTVMTMKGTYTKKVLTENLSQYYFISNGEVCQAEESLTINPFRAYMEAATPAAGRIRLSEADVTAINAVFNAENSDVKVVSIYGANGVQQKDLQKGINIVKLSNNTVKKIIVK